MKNIILLIFLFIAAAVQAQPQWVIYTQFNSGLPSSLIGSILIDSNNVKWVTTDNGLAKLQGNTWTVYDTSNSGLPQNHCYGIVLDKKNIMWMTCPGKGIVKFDGINWTVYNNENTGLPVNWSGYVDVDENNNKWFAGHGLFKYNDTNWVYYNTGNSGLPTNSTICTYVKDNNIWVGTYMGGLVKFDGVNWTLYNTQNSGIPSSWIYMITSDLQNNLWFATFFGGLAKYNESQNIWTVYNTTNSGLHHNNLYSIYVDNNNVKWIGGGGMAIFNDTTWQIFTYPFITEVFNFSKDRYGNMWICSDIGLYVYNPAGVVGVENNSAKVIDDFELFQNYPNPFNSMTNIQFQVPLCHSGESRNPLVVIKVFNILGREVKTLVNEYKHSGTYQVSFNAEGLTSGIYFYKMTAGDFSETKKLVLIK
jgi:ligand-binding sensor domain-containing protein